MGNGQLLIGGRHKCRWIRVLALVDCDLLERFAVAIMRMRREITYTALLACFRLLYLTNGEIDE